MSRRRCSRASVMTFFQMMLLAALTIFFSTFATPVVNFFLSFGIFMVGNLVQRHRIADDQPDRSPALSAPSFTTCCPTSATSIFRTR